MHHKPILSMFTLRGTNSFRTWIFWNHCKSGTMIVVAPFGAHIVPDLAMVMIWLVMISNVKCKVSTSLTPLLGSFPLTPLDMVKGGSHMLSFNFYSLYSLILP
jgi:hypothetical protein